MMRPGIAVLVGGFLAAAAVARTPANPQAPTAPSAPAQAEPLPSALPSGTALNAQLDSSVDSKKAKVGDKVGAHSTEAVAMEGRTLVPKGAKLEGHVTEATARSKGDHGSSLAIQFDKAIPKKGEEIPLKVLIMAVAPPQSVEYGGATGPPSDPMEDRGAAAAGGSPMGSSRPQSTTNGIPNHPSSGGAPASGGPTSDRSGSSQLPSTSRGVYGLKDLKLMERNSPAGQSTVITSEGKSVHLDGGTRLLLVAQGASAASAPAPNR